MKTQEQQTGSTQRPFVSKDGIAITNRFFQALDILKMQGKLHAISKFTDRHNINRWNFYTIKNNPEKAMLKPEYILYLCEDYHVSLEWIFFARGDFYDMSVLKTKEQ